MILVAGLSPAWQRILEFDTLRPGHVNRARQVHECPSGKVLNVAHALQRLGRDVLGITVLGGPRGRDAQRVLAELGVPMNVLETDAPTRICQTLLCRETGTTTELVEEAAPLSAGDVDAFLNQTESLLPEARCLVLTGSLPPNVPADLYRRLTEAANCPVILDAQGEPLRAALVAQPTVIKPNREELGRTVGRSLDTTADVIAAARELQSAGAQWIVVSDGPRPLIVVGPGDAFRVQPPPPSRVVNPIGCGDCLAAGIAAKLAEGPPDDLRTAVPYGVACSLENLGSLIPARLDRHNVDDLCPRIAVADVAAAEH